MWLSQNESLAQWSNHDSKKISFQYQIENNFQMDFYLNLNVNHQNICACLSKYVGRDFGCTSREICHTCGKGISFIS